MPLTYDDFQTAATFIRERIPVLPKVALILGSGLGPLAEAVENPVIIPFGEIPNWPTSTVVGHAGRLVVGTLEGKAILVMQGRVHFYEGVDMEMVGYPIRVMQALGIETLIVTNAAGAVNKSFKEGELMVLSDHINFIGLAGMNPLVGPNDDRLGPRFTPLTRAYDASLRRLALKVAEEKGIKLNQGVYFALGGPFFETPAEIRMIRLLGGDAVGMSTASEVVVAKHAGMQVLGFSSITNECIDDPDDIKTVNHEEVLAVGLQIVPNLIQILRGVLHQLEA